MIRNPAFEQRVLEALRAHSARAERSQQVRIGMSEVGGCARALAHRLLATPATNTDTQVCASLRGTAMHSVLEEALVDANAARYSKEVEVEYRGLMGHLDLYDVADRCVVDYKTKDRDGMASAKSYGPDRAHVWQLMLYAAGLGAQGVPVEKVRLCYVSVSSTDDVYAIEMPYEQAIADAAIEHLENVRTNAEAGVLPEPERDASSFCAKFCRFYDATGEQGCTGRTDKATEYVATDPWDDGAPNAAAAADYGKGLALEKEGAAMKKAAKEKLVGSRGVAGGWVVSWTNPEPKVVPDLEAAAAALVELGMTVPTMVKQMTPSISVRPLVKQ